jgi:tRNA/tmRNA/rRNA uracil-C5-methylase (TrmA/RlmC/RlmD family)
MVNNMESKIISSTSNTPRSNKKRKFRNGTREITPQAGEPGFKTPTQLRNERKRRAKKMQKSSMVTSTSEMTLQDPSSQYLSDPKKAPIVQRALQFFHDHPWRQRPQHQPIFPIFVGQTIGWRTVSKLAVRRTNGNSKPSKLSIGLFAPNSHQVIPVPNCPAHHPSINHAVPILERLCAQLGIVAYDETTGQGLLRHVAMNVERMTGKIQMTLVWNSEPSQDGDWKELTNAIIRIIHQEQLDSHHNGMEDNAFGMVKESTKRRRRRGKTENTTITPSLQNFKSTPIIKTDDVTMERSCQLNLHSLWIHFNSSGKHNNAIFSIDGKPERWKHIYGPSVVEETLELSGQTIPIPLRFPPNVFRQGNLDAFTKIVDSIREFISSHWKDSREKPTCVELYGGVGTIGLNVADLTSSLISSDENPFNNDCFQSSSLNLEDPSTVSYQSKNATDMVRDGALERGQIIIVDPPRKGLEDEVRLAICNSKTPELLIYVSCGFDAFQRDCKELVQSGWNLERAEGHILFPGSDAIETLAFFTYSPTN